MTFHVSETVISSILCCAIDQTAKEVPLLTPLEKALQWAEKGESDCLVERFVPSQEERLSFAALQPIAGSLEISRAICFCISSRSTCQ